MNDWVEIKSLSVAELWQHGTLEMYHGGSFTDPTTFCGRCWQALKEETPGKRIIDWRLYKEDIEDILTSLDHFKADKNHPDYIFLSEKLTVARLYDSIDLDPDQQYSDLEIICLGMIPNGNRLDIPKNVFIANYKAVKEIMLNFEGKYSKNGFVFPYPGEDVLSRIRKKETLNLKKKFQFFATPSAIGRMLCEMTIPTDFKGSIRFCEPSCGQGGIIDEILKYVAEHDLSLDSITGIEFMKENYDVLNRKYPVNQKIILHEMDFLKFDEFINRYDFVIANPPFAKGQDIDHVMKMYDICKPTGTVTSIMSTGWMYHTGKKQTAFRRWLGFTDDDSFDLKQLSKGDSDYEGFRTLKNGNIERIAIKSLSGGEFKESGTNVTTCIVQIRKNDVSGFEPKEKKDQKNQQLNLF